MALTTGTILAAVTAATSVGTTVHSVQQSRKADKARQRETVAQNRIQERRSQREKLDQIRQARIQAGLAQNVAAVTGIQEGSVEGIGSSVLSQLGTNINYIDQQMTDARFAMERGNKAAQLQSDAATYDAIGRVAGSAFTQFGGMADLEAIGKTSKVATAVPTPTFASHGFPYRN